MTVHFKVNGGIVKSGRINGVGEIYTSNGLGSGNIHKGNFISGKLNDVNGTYIIYDNDSYAVYTGTFVDNKMDGYIEVLTFSSADPITEDEKKCRGNDHCRTTGLRYIYASENNMTLSGRKKTVIYSNGVEGATLEDAPQDMKIIVEQKVLNNRLIFSNFQIVLND